MKNVSLTNLIEQTILDQMRCKASFTALDISNTLKLDRYPVAHREVSAAVREIYESGAMAFFDYERKVIPVVTEGDAKQTQAFLYHFTQVRPRAYRMRNQNALPPVPADKARDMSDYTPVCPRPLRPAMLPSLAQPRRSDTRRDGALSIPRCFLRQLGWSDGQTLSLTAGTGELSLQPANDDSADVRVWSSARLRICRTKLRIGDLAAENVTILVENGQINIASTKNPRAERRIESGQ